MRCQSRESIEHGLSLRAFYLTQPSTTFAFPMDIIERAKCQPPLRERERGNEAGALMVWDGMGWCGGVACGGGLSLRPRGIWQQTTWKDTAGNGGCPERDREREVSQCLFGIILCPQTPSSSALLCLTIHIYRVETKPNSKNLPYDHKTGHVDPLLGCRRFYLLASSAPPSNRVSRDPCVNRYRYALNGGLQVV